jgi:hypothetical protein
MANAVTTYRPATRVDTNADVLWQFLLGSGVSTDKPLERKQFKIISEPLNDLVREK